MRQVLVKVDPPAMTALSGMVTSATNSSLSQGTGMDVELGLVVLVAGILVGFEVLVAREVWVAAACCVAVPACSSVGTMVPAICVRRALTVSAAAVLAASGSSVGVLTGKLQADNRSSRILIPIVIRKVLRIYSSWF
jgi:hypothetical protein